MPRTFADVVDAFLASEKFKSLAPSTRRCYRIYLGMAAQPSILGSYPTEQLRPSLIQQFVDGLTELAAAQRLALAAIKSMQAWAIVRELLPHPITIGVQASRDGGHHQPWTAAQVAAALAHAAPEVARIVAMGAYTGQRGSDLCRMRWADIETVGGQPGIHVTQQKTGLRLWVPLLPELQAVMQGWPREPGHILRRRDGTPWGSRAHLSAAWIRERDGNEALAKCRGLVLHGLRGFAVVRLRRLGLTPLQVCDMIGMSPKVIETYCALANQQESALAAVHSLFPGAASNFPCLSG